MSLVLSLIVALLCSAFTVETVRRLPPELQAVSTKKRYALLNGSFSSLPSVVVQQTKQLLLSASVHGMACCDAMVVNHHRIAQSISNGASTGDALAGWLVNATSSTKATGGNNTVGSAYCKLTVVRSSHYCVVKSGMRRRGTWVEKRK